MADQQFCLRWNNHQSTLISVFDTLLENGTLVDCTLAAEGQYLKAHKVVLSACSPYLETLLSQHYEKHPIVILKDVKFTELKSMMDYMYRGEVNISQDQLGTFLKAAESLQIKGLSDNAEGDARDVGSTSKVPPPQRKPTQPAAPTTRPVEPQRPESPTHRSRDGSISPSSRKRRRIRRNSHEEELGDNHLDANCDLQSQAQSTPIVPNIPASITTTPIKTPIVKPDINELNRIENSNINSLPPESGLLKEKIEPISEPLLEPKTEYIDEVNNEDSVEDLTLDDDDEMDEMDVSNMSNLSNMSRPGPSHGTDISNQGFSPWQLGGNQTGTDEVFMAAQEAVSAHRDSQGVSGARRVTCEVCHRSYSCMDSLKRHVKYECGKPPQFQCPYCPRRTRRKDGLKAHITYSSSVQAVLALRHSVWGWHRERDGDSARRRRRRHISMVDTPWRCPDCGKCYIYQRGLNLHRRFECGKEPMFQCPHCPKKCHQPGNLTVHVRNKHGQNGKLEISLLSKSNQSDLHAEIKSDLVAN